MLKGETLGLFQRYWPNPAAGLPDAAGTFGIARYGDILFFLLDDRWYRSPNAWPEGPDKTMFGARQLEWLKQALVSAPRSALKIVAAGSQFWHRGLALRGLAPLRRPSATRSPPGSCAPGSKTCCSFPATGISASS